MPKRFTNDEIAELQANQDKNIDSIIAMVVAGTLPITKFKPTKFVKQKVVEYLLNIPDLEERRLALTDAAGLGRWGKEHYVHKFLMTQRHVLGKKPSKERGSLKVVHDALVGMGASKAESVRQSSSSSSSSSQSYSVYADEQWSDQLPYYAAIESLLFHNSVEDLQVLLDEVDHANQTLRDYLYQEAQVTPSILYLMLQQDLVLPDDYQRLASLRAKLDAEFNSGKRSDAQLLAYVTEKSNPDSPLYRFMNNVQPPTSVVQPATVFGGRLPSYEEATRGSVQPPALRAHDGDEDDVVRLPTYTEATQNDPQPPADDAPGSPIHSSHC